MGQALLLAAEYKEHRVSPVPSPTETMSLFRFPAPIFFLSIWFWGFFVLFVVVILLFFFLKSGTYIHFYLSGSKPRRISVQITVTEQQMVKVELLLFQNLATPPSTTGSTTFLRLESGQDLVTELTHIASNFKAKGTWLLPGLLIILGLGS